MPKIVVVSDRAIELNWYSEKSQSPVADSRIAQSVSVLSNWSQAAQWPTCEWVQADGSVCVVFRQPFESSVKQRALLKTLQTWLHTLGIDEENETKIDTETCHQPTPQLNHHASREHVIEVAYGGLVGQDLAPLARELNMTQDEFVSIHSQAIYSVSFLGFLPGFAYLKGLDSRLVVPRRESPRAHVPAGALAIANGYCAVYPWQSPGGWHLIGRVAAELFDVNASEQAALFKPGDTVRFVQVDHA